MVDFERESRQLKEKKHRKLATKTVYIVTTPTNINEIEAFSAPSLLSYTVNYSQTHDKTKQFWFQRMGLYSNKTRIANWNTCECRCAWLTRWNVQFSYQSHIFLYKKKCICTRKKLKYQHSYFFSVHIPLTNCVLSQNCDRICIKGVQCFFHRLKWSKEFRIMKKKCLNFKRFN